MANNLVLVTHGAGGDLARLEEMKISEPTCCHWLAFCLLADEPL